ncbi:MAG: outer membrane beta-barrel protein [Bauldia sp.]
MRAAEAPPLDWSGPVFGTFVGYSAGRLITTESSLTTDGTLFGIGPTTVDTYYGADSDVPFEGAFGGALIGFNRQVGAMVFGAEADIAAANFVRSDTVPGAPHGDPRIDTSATLHWFGTLRGTIGLAADRFHIYGTGGLAYGNAEGQVSVTPSGGTVPPTFTAGDSRMQYGYALGGGIEAAIDRHWTARLEFLYLNLGAARYDFAFPASNGSTSTSADTVTANTVRGGLLYRF